MVTDMSMFAINSNIGCIETLGGSCPPKLVFAINSNIGCIET